MKITAIVTAGGTQARWSGTQPKQLAVVDGKTILARLAEQLETFCYRISVLAWRPEILNICPGAWMPDTPYSEDLLPVLHETEGLWDERTLIVHGDVVFGTNSLNLLKELRSPVGFLGTKDDIFAMTFVKAQKRKVHDAIEAAIQYGFSDNPLQHGRLKLWSLYRHLIGVDPGIHEFGQDPMFRHTVDWTMDVDTLGQYALLQEKMNRARAAGQL